MIKKIIPFMLIIVCVIAVFGCSGKTPVVGTISGSDKNVTVKTESANSKSGMTVFQLFPNIIGFRAPFFSGGILRFCNEEDVEVCVPELR